MIDVNKKIYVKKNKKQIYDGVDEIYVDDDDDDVVIVLFFIVDAFKINLRIFHFNKIYKMQNIKIII